MNHSTCSLMYVCSTCDTSLFQMTIETDDMDLAGDIVQSLANYLDIMV